MPKELLNLSITPEPDREYMIRTRCGRLTIGPLDKPGVAQGLQEGWLKLEDRVLDFSQKKDPTIKARFFYFPSVQAMMTERSYAAECADITAPVFTVTGLVAILGWLFFLALQVGTSRAIIAVVVALIRFVLFVAVLGILGLRGTNSPFWGCALTGGFTLLLGVALAGVIGTDILPDENFPKLVIFGPIIAGMLGWAVGYLIGWVWRRLHRFRQARAARRPVSQLHWD